MTFLREPNDRITDDGNPLYQHGKDSISCLYHEGGTGDLTFHDSTQGNRLGPRRLNYNFGTPNAFCGAIGGVPPASSQPVGLTVNNIRDVALYDTQPRRVVFFLSEGLLQFFGQTDSCSTSTLVHVTRVDASTWTISSEFDQSEQAVFNQSIKNQGVLIYYWEMPFHIQVTLQ